MSYAITQHLNEQLRDAMLALYMHVVLPQDPTLNALTLTDPFTSVDDVYTYWLLDPQVSQAVPTTRIASAIASLQQYINGIYLGLEPGYTQSGMSAEQQATWQDELLTYSLWRARQQLEHYPASYLSPTLRHDKSDNFKQLENELNQFQIQPAPLLSAVHGYLNRFEELATIKTLNGYIDGDTNSLANSVYYFIGKSSSDNTYYWRTLDLSRPLHAGGAAHTNDVPAPTAWSGWKKIHLSIDENVPEQSIRPVVFNGRLFVVWAQCINPTAPADTTPFGRGEDESARDYQQRVDARLKNNFLQFRLNFSYMKRDDSWSTPRVCIQKYSLSRHLDELAPEDLLRATTSIAVLDANTRPASLFLGLSAHANNQLPSQPNGTRRDFYQAVRLDPHFNIQWLETIGSPTTLFPWHRESMLAGRYLTLFAHHNKANLQFRAPENFQVQPQSVIPDAPHASSSGWNCENSQGKIRNLRETDIRFNTTTSVLEVSTGLESAFTPHRTVTFDTTHERVNVSMTLSTGARLENGLLMLDANSLFTLKSRELPGQGNWRVEFTIKCNQTGVRYQHFIRTVHDTPVELMSTPAKDAENNPGRMEVSLAEYAVTAEAFDYFFNTSKSLYTITLSVDNGATPLLHNLVLDKTHAAQKQRLYKPVLMHPKQANLGQLLSPHRNNTVLVGHMDASRRNLLDTFTELPHTHTLDVQIELDPKTLRPYGEGPHETAPDTLTLIHGVLLLESDVHYPDPVILGYALKTATFKLDPGNSTPIIPRAPGIRRLASPLNGTAEFIDFSESSIKDSVTGAAPRAPIRTNTCVANLLTSTSNGDLHQVFATPLDTWLEPPLQIGGAATAPDFNGAHGSYFWELFLYLPWLLAHRLNQEQQYAQAHAWLRYLFDPSAQPTAGNPTAYWRLAELLTNTPQPSLALRPSMPTSAHFRQAIYLLHVDILLNRGDAAYRQSTRDSLAEAKLWYIRAKGLLGPRPPSSLVEPWTSTTLAQLQGFSATGAPRLCRALSPDLLLRWDKIDARLHTLRQHLDLTGKPLSLPLYAATLTPQALLAAYPHGANGAGTRAALRTAQAGHYRFQVILGHAMQAVENLVQLGNTLLTLLERKEQAHALQTQQQHAWELARIAVEQQAQAVQFDVKNRDALLAGRRIVEGRVAFFEAQLKAGITPAEALASQEYQQSAHWDAMASVAQVGAGLAMLVPNIFGTSNGGVRYEGAFHALQASAQGLANDKRANAAHLDRSDQFARRAAEWAQALDQARLELAQVDAQLQAYTQQEASTRLQLRLAQTAMAQARTLYDLLGKRFTDSQLYQWLNSQLSVFYFQAYDSALSLCLAAEACWQEERAQWDQRFIQTQLWTHQYRGLSAGEGLKQNLLAMSSAYVTQHERLLEITKTVSLRQLHEKDPQATTNTPWDTLQANLVQTGTLSFALTLKLFDDDYPGQYLRRIKTVSVSLPAVLGPYEDVKAVLTQTANTTQLEPSPAQADGANDNAVKKDLRVRQEVALSSAMNDSGLFTLNFDNDERYLPFEYTGAISSWQLTFPHHSRQRALLESLSDIIVHLRYTAKSSGGQR